MLGGGVVPGSLILVGGDPGIGKSTLLLQTSHALAAKGLKVLYISGEESVRQTRLRADRLGALSETLYVLCETNMEQINEAIESVKPDFLVIDSIQTVYDPQVQSAPGSVSQVRECTAHFMRIAKIKGIATVLVGHVTKEGAIAGPRMLEHMVDCVLYFEGERHHTYRIVAGGEEPFRLDERNRHFRNGGRRASGSEQSVRTVLVGAAAGRVGLDRRGQHGRNEAGACRDAGTCRDDEFPFAAAYGDRH